MKTTIYKYNITELDLKLNQSLEQIDFSKTNESKHLWITFGPFELTQSISFKEFLKKIPDSHYVMGCSTSGEIFNSQVSDNTLVIAHLEFEKTNLKLILSNITESENSSIVGKEIGEKLNSSDLKGIIIFTDGLKVNGSELLLGLNSVIEKHVVVSGGMAGDNALFKNTWVISGRTPQSGVVAALGIYGDHIELQNGAHAGWENFGPVRKITKSHRNVLYTIDDEPALQLYKKYLGEKATSLPATGLLFPLNLWDEKKSDYKFVRTILAINEADQSITFAGNIPEGHCAQLMKTNYERLIVGTSELLKKINFMSDSFTLAISCIGRKLVLGVRVDEEIESYYKGINFHHPQIGFYSFGEICALQKGNSSELLNQSLSLLHFKEK